MILLVTSNVNYLSLDTFVSYFTVKFLSALSSIFLLSNYDTIVAFFLISRIDRQSCVNNAVTMSVGL